MAGNKKLGKTGKKVLISVTALVLVAAIGAGIWFGTQPGGETVGVYPFEYIGMTEYWGDNQESYGPVTTDRIQTVFLSDTLTVTEVLVKQDDMVKKGDPLISFDTTMSGLKLERKRLEAEKLKLQVNEAEAELMDIKNLKPMTEIIVDGLPTEPYLGEELKDPYRAYIVANNDGMTLATPFVCWLRDDTDINDALLEALRQKVWGKLGLCEHDEIAEKCLICNPPRCVHGDVEAKCPICRPQLCEHNNIEALCPKCRCRHDRVRKDCEICTPVECLEHGYLKATCPICNQCVHGKLEDDCEICSPEICQHKQIKAYCQECAKLCEHGLIREECPVCTLQPGEDPTVEGTEGTEGTEGLSGLSSDQDKGYFIRFLNNTTTQPDTGSAIYNYYVVFKTTDGNKELSGTKLWQGVHVSGQGTDFTLSYFTPAFQDYTLPETDDDSIWDMPGYTGSMFTAAQLAQMRKDQEKKIKDLEFKLKMAEAEYKIMEKELGDGTIYAEFDGQVVSLLTEEEAKSQKQPMVKVSGGGGFYIEGSVSELEKDNLEIGQEVTVNDWRTGGMYTGTVQSIGDFPSSSDSWNGMGNPNASYYPFTAFVGEEADLQAGAYVSVQYSTSGNTHGIYLDKAFIRTEQGRSYVYVLGADSRLEKRYVTTGKSLWGSYLEILEGVTEEDKLAFPYGKNVKDGAKAEEKDLSDLYMY